ncbi:MAG: spore cortex-lytic enzyme [Eubacteriaceae bacterium]|nr:spore cortex-lytic enzyme [Eubacteriaceae bacterium]
MNLSKRIMIAWCIAVVMFLVFPTVISARETIYYGSSDTKTIKQIQTKLKNWGYYDGEVDGVFGYKTETAVKKFQEKNGLKVDGKVGNQTYAALGMSSGSSSSSSSGASSGSTSASESKEVMLLARCINGEARGEPYAGQVAVAAVILNRVDHEEFPDTVSGVIYQSGAFDAVMDGQINLTPNESCIRAAKDALNGWDPTGGAIYYYNPVTATNKWIRTRPIITTIGRHVFCE